MRVYDIFVIYFFVVYVVNGIWLMFKFLYMFNGRDVIKNVYIYS